MWFINLSLYTKKYTKKKEICTKKVGKSNFNEKDLIDAHLLQLFNVKYTCLEQKKLPSNSARETVSA